MNATPTEPTTTADPDEVRRILEERAAALAEAPADEDPGERLELVVVVLGRERYGIPIELVREIKPLGQVTPLAATPPHWLGLTNLRGTLYPVLDLRRYLGGTGAGDGDDPQLVVVAAAGVTIGLRVDGVHEVRSVRIADIGPALVERSADRPDVHAGLTRDLVSVLDVEALLADRRLTVQEGIDIS